MVWVLYPFKHVVFCMRGLNNESHNIEATLPNLDNINNIGKDQ